MNVGNINPIIIKGSVKDFANQELDENAKDLKGSPQTLANEKKFLKENIDFSDPHKKLRTKYTEEDGTQGSLYVKKKLTCESKHDVRVLHREEKQNTKAQKNLTEAGTNLQEAQDEFDAIKNKTNISESDLKAKQQRLLDAEAKYNAANTKEKVEVEGEQNTRETWKLKEDDAKAKRKEIVKPPKHKGPTPEEIEKQKTEKEYLQAKKEFEDAQLTYSKDGKEFKKAEEHLNKAKNKHEKASNEVQKENGELSKAQADADCLKYKVKVKVKEVLNNPEDGYKKTVAKFKGIVSTCDEGETPVKREPAPELLKPIEAKIPTIEVKPILIPTLKPIVIPETTKEIHVVNNNDSHSGFGIQNGEMINKKNHVTNAQSAVAVIGSGNDKSTGKLTTLAQGAKERTQHLGQMFTDLNVDKAGGLSETDLQNFTKMYKPNAKAADPNIRTQAPNVDLKNNAITKWFNSMIKGTEKTEVTQDMFTNYMNAHLDKDGNIILPE